MRRLFSLTVAIVIVALLVEAGVNASDGAASPAWTAPSIMAVKRVSDIPDAQNEPNLFSNLDCTPIDYHLTYSSTVLSGCFTPSAFGAIDSDSEAVIFNGTDEGLPLLLTKDLFGGLGGHSVACSGATIGDVGDLSNGYKGQAKGASSWQQMRESNLALIATTTALMTLVTH